MLRLLYRRVPPLRSVRCVASAPSSSDIKLPDEKSKQELDPNRYDEWGNEIPEDLRLPEPSSLARRFKAGLIDASISAVVGGLVGGMVMHGTGVWELAEASGVLATTMAWVCRDAVLDDGNRSLGKKLQKLELVHWDGTMASRSTCLKRNMYFLVFPFMYFHPLLNQVQMSCF